MLRKTTYAILCPVFKVLPFFVSVFNLRPLLVFCIFSSNFLNFNYTRWYIERYEKPYIGLVENDVNVQTSHHPQLGLCTMEPTTLTHLNNLMELPHSWSDQNQSKRAGPIRLLSFHRYVIRTSLCIIITLNRYMILFLYAHPCS